MKTQVCLALCALHAYALETTASWFYKQGERPLVIGHRGSLGHFPEHTLGGYTDAWLLGVDWVELDIQMTSDGVLIASHDECLKDSTNAVLYDKMWKKKQKDIFIPSSGHLFLDDYPVPEMTYEECRMVKRRQRYDYRSNAMDGFFMIPSMQEVVDHMKFLTSNYDTRSRIKATTVPGLYIEIKEPDWYSSSYGIDMTQALFDFLEKNGLETIEKSTKNGIPIIVQSFSEDSLVEFSKLSDLPRVQLIRTDQVYDIPHVASYAHGVGPASDLIMYWPDMDKRELFDPTTPSAFIEMMHNEGLQVHPYTLRIDNLQYTNSPAAEIELYATKGCDGVFTEFISTTLTVWDQMYQ